MSDGPKIILFDLETMPNMGEVMKVFPRLSDYPGLTLKATITSIICFGYKVLGEKKSKVLSAWDFPKLWDKNINNDYEICKAAYDILSEADAVVTHNGRRFDWKFLQTRLLVNGLPSLPRITHIDTCQVAKSNLLSFNNRLGTLGKSLVNDDKLDNGGWELWEKVMTRDPKALALMVKYCKQDVDLLEKIFLKLRPLIKNIPNHNAFTLHGIKSCPSCGSVKIYHNGTRASTSGRYQRYMCNECGSSFRSKTTLSKTIVRPE